MAKIGYARVSTHGQKDDSQVDELKAAGCEKIFVDHGVSGKLAARPQWDACLAYLRAGDVLVITRLSRAMRSLHQLLDVVNGTRANDYDDGLRARGIDLVVLKQQIDTTTPQGRLVFNILAAIDEFQRELIVEGTLEGLESARARGRKGGRPRKLSEQQEALARELYDGRQHTVSDIAALLKVSRGTIYSVLERKGEEAS